MSSEISYLLKSVGKQPIHSYFQRQTKLNCIVCPCFVIHRQTTILVILAWGGGRLRGEVGTWGFAGVFPSFKNSSVTPFYKTINKRY